MSERAFLQLPIGDETVVVQSEAALPLRLLTMTSALLRIPPDSSVSRDADIIVRLKDTGKRSPDEVVLKSHWEFPGEFLLLPGNRIAIELNDCLIRRNMALGIIRFLTTFAGMIPLLRGQSSFFLHGGAVRFPNTGEGVVFFGESGIGKSTAVERFVRQGGEAIGDDMLLLTRDCSGTLWVQPLPTWSSLWYPNEYLQHTVPLRQKTPVKAVMELTRGSGDRICRETVAMGWKVRLLKALHNHLGAILTMLPPTETKSVSLALLSFADQIAAQFPPLYLEGDLAGTIYSNLYDHLHARKE